MKKFRKGRLPSKSTVSGVGAIFLFVEVLERHMKCGIGKCARLLLV
ncbi:MAG: hypothetical protein H5T33_06840 [Candidatus Methanosuratus sp.]|nr:hypothetical protein [Candidatus Methanosuratincola sp.]